MKNWTKAQSIISAAELNFRLAIYRLIRYTHFVVTLRICN